jgi:hypothetical protein
MVMKGVMQVSWLFLPGFGLGDFFGMFQNTTNNIEAIAYGNNRFVAVSSGGKMAYADW